MGAKKSAAITRTEHLAVATGYEQAAATWRESGNYEESARLTRLARERRILASDMPLRVVR